MWEIAAELDGSTRIEVRSWPRIAKPRKFRGIFTTRSFGNLAALGRAFQI